MMRYKIGWAYATYYTTFTVFAETDDEAIAQARALARRQGLRSLPMAYETWRVLETRPVEGSPAH